PDSSIINIDDEWGRKLADDLKAEGQRVVTFSLTDSADSSTTPSATTPSAEAASTPPRTEGELNPAADLTARDISVSLIKGTSFRLSTPIGERTVHSPLVGKPHVYNMLAATSAAFELGYSLDAIQKGLEKCVGAPGRFERVPHDGDFAVVVDYAHSDDALLNVLRTARELTNGKIITVFGCGGDRDKTKRGPMGEVAGRHSDFVIVTSDNPRTENPLKIIEEIEAGLKNTKCEYQAVSDRRDAIFRALKKADTNDVVLIAGKGHENYQIIGNEKFDFDDRKVALEALEKLKEE
ncbi:MAG: cyanophycin synthetase, partial [Pyrinomonadaceae bacterium]